jgi:hypothetical protein
LKEICEVWNVNYDCELKKRGETLFTPEAGEHKYSDSYILKGAQSFENAESASDMLITANDEDTINAPKRVKVGL